MARSGRAILALLAVIIVIDAFVFPSIARRMGEHAGGGLFLPLDLRFLYSPDEAYAALASLGPEGRRLYTMVELSVDILYPLTYAVFFFLLTRWMLAKTQPVPRWAGYATVLPFAAMALDWFENALVVAMIRAFPRRMDTIASLASGVTAAKLVCFGVVLALSIYAGGRWLLSRARGPA